MQLPFLSSLWNSNAHEIAWEYLLSGVAKGVVILVHTAHLVVDVTSQGLQTGSALLPIDLSGNLQKETFYKPVETEKEHIPGSPYNTFDGPGFPACHAVAQVHYPTTVDEIVHIVREVISADNGTHVRATGIGHMWYDTMCLDDSNTIIIRTEGVNKISNLVMTGDVGTVDLEAGVTFLQLADWLHERDASMSYTLVNWNITIAGSIAMGAHRSSLDQDSQVSSAAVELEILNGKGELVRLKKDQSDDTWLAATTSLGLLGIITRVKLAVVTDFKVSAHQITLEEDEVLNGDIYGFIAPHVTANFWWWPGLKKFHLRTYEVVPKETQGDGFQSTFSVTPLEGRSARILLDLGQSSSWPNFLAEKIFYDYWCAPNFHDKITDKPLKSWPVVGWAYDVLIGGLYPGQRPEWEYGLHGYTFEIAVPVVEANALLKRVRQLLDEAAAQGKPVTATYRSGINIKFGKQYDSLLGQTTTRVGEVKGDWSKGAIMFDFPTYRPSKGDHHRYNEEFYANLAQTLINEFPARPHWSKSSRAVLRQTVKNLDKESLQRFSEVREAFDPKKIYYNVVGDILKV